MVIGTTICSTMHCYNEAEIEPVAIDGKWWVQIPNPAPFCKKCKKRTGKQ